MDWERLKNLLKNQGMTQRQLAERLGINEKTLSDRLNRDLITVTELLEILKVLEYPVGRFLVDYDADKLVEIDARERELLKLFREFSEEQREKVLRMLEIMKGF